MTKTILKYLLNKMSIAVTGETIEIDKRILALVKLRGKKPLKNKEKYLERQLIVDKMTKEIEYSIKHIKT